MDLSLTPKQKLIVFGMILWIIIGPLVTASIVFPEELFGTDNFRDVFVDLPATNNTSDESEDTLSGTLDIAIILCEIMLFAVKIIFLRILFQKFRLGAAMRHYK